MLLSSILLALFLLPATLGQKICALSEITYAGCLNDLVGCICFNATLQLQLSICVRNSCNLTEQLRSSTILQDEVCEGIPQPSRSAEIENISIILAVITFTVVALRCLSRYLVVRKFWWDDLVIILAAIFLIALSACAILYPHYGLGKHIWSVPPSNITLLGKMYYVSQILYSFINALTKISILLFYLRVIPTDKFSMRTKICIVWMVCHLLGFTMAAVFQCVPVNALWDTDIEGRCINSEAFGFAAAGASILEDFVMIFLPISELRTLNLDARKKAAVMFMFALGSFACIASIIRLKFMINFGNSKSSDGTWEQVDVIIWSEIEAYVGVICACLITLRGLFVRYLPGLFASSGTKDREPRDNSALPSWRVRRSSKMVVNLGYGSNMIELSSADYVQTDQGMKKSHERQNFEPSSRSKESLEIEEIMIGGE